MSDSDGLPDPAELRRRSLSRWDNEGGAISSAPKLQKRNGEAHTLTNAEVVQLRIRVIALENLMIAVLAEGSDRQRDLARQMAEFILPRPGFTQHPLTIRAADHMTDLVERAVNFEALKSE